MNTSYFREFIILAEVKNYWGAASRLYMNQSTLSKHIKAMEQELGVALFERSTRRVELTKYGKALLPYARSISHAESEYSSLLLQMQDQEKGLLIIGSIPAMAQYGIVDLLSAFQKEHPKNDVNILEDDSRNLPCLLRERKCELIFLRESRLDFEKNFLEDGEFVRIPFARDRLVALLPAGHPLSGSESLSLRDLQNDNFCILKEGTLLYSLCIDACHMSGFVPKVTFTSHRIESILNMVASGECVGLLMDRHLMYPEGASFYAQKELSPVPVTPDVCSQISLCYLANTPLSDAAAGFVELLQKHTFLSPGYPG